MSSFYFTFDIWLILHSEFTVGDLLEYKFAYYRPTNNLAPCALVLAVQLSVF